MKRWPSALMLVAACGIAMVSDISHAQETDGCPVKGVIKYNNNALGAGESVICHSSNPPSATTTVAGHLGDSPPYNYQCTVGTGSFYLEARGQSAPECKDASQNLVLCESGYDPVICNANVTGCGSYSVTFVTILLPMAVLAPRVSRRRRGGRRAAR